MHAGVSNIWGVGQLESEMTFSPAQAVIDNEMIAYALHHKRGVALTPETLAVEVTREVGPAGSFLEHDHTAEHFREELFHPTLLPRQRRTDWNDKGAPTLADLAEQQADTLIARPPENALTPDQSAALQRITTDFLATFK
jgi:trimethylamine--corrinoid protein Co-methyltransferase